jgi:hypothetical protein
MSCRQVDFVFQLFDMSRDGFISPADPFAITGVDYFNSLKTVRGREGKLTFALPPVFAEPGNQKGDSIRGRMPAF